MKRIRIVLPSGSLKFDEVFAYVRRETSSISLFHPVQEISARKDRTCVTERGCDWTSRSASKDTANDSLHLDIWRERYFSSWKHRHSREMGNHPSAHQPLERATSHAGNGLRLSVGRSVVFTPYVTFTFTCACYTVTAISVMWDETVTCVYMLWQL